MSKTGVYLVCVDISGLNHIWYILTCRERMIALASPAGHISMFEDLRNVSPLEPECHPPLLPLDVVFRRKQGNANAILHHVTMRLMAWAVCTTCMLRSCNVYYFSVRVWLILDSRKTRPLRPPPVWVATFGAVLSSSTHKRAAATSNFPLGRIRTGKIS